MIPIAKKVEEFLQTIESEIKVAVMGCAVNALGEAKHADVAIAFGNNDGLVIKRGKIVGKYSQDELIDVFIKEVMQTEQEMLQAQE